METSKSEKIKVAEDHLSLSAVTWVNHCVYFFRILQVGDSGMAVSISRGDSVLYAETIPYNTPTTVIVGGQNGFIHGTLTATSNSLNFDGNLEQSNMVLTNMTVGLLS